MITFRESTRNRTAIDKLNRLIKELRKPNRDRFARVQRAILSGFAENFETQSAGGIPWQPLSPSTMRQRALFGYGAERPILERTGGYKDTFINPANADHVSEFEQSGGKTTVGEGSKDFRAKFHEQGGPVIPKRQVTVLSAQSKDRVLEELRLMVGLILNGR